MKKLRITVEGKVYEVTVEILGEKGHETMVPATGTPKSSDHKITPLPSQEQSPVKEQGTVTSPMAGRVVSVFVQLGQRVKEGDQLMILEAMKMNNHVYAPTDGTIHTLYVKIGDAVEEGQPLLNIS